MSDVLDPIVTGQFWRLACDGCGKTLRVTNHEWVVKEVPIDPLHCTCGRTLLWARISLNDLLVDRPGVNLEDEIKYGGFTEEMHSCMSVVHENSKNKGFWETSTNTSEKVMLMVCEAAELIEGIRHGNPPSDHIPLFSAAEEEMADIFIRGMDLAKKMKWRLPEAILAKMAFNQTRPHMHGGKAF